MDGPTLLIGLAGVLATAAPLVVAVIGETFTERAGLINLSVNGTILLSAMGGFVVALSTRRVPGSGGRRRDRRSGGFDRRFRRASPTPVTGGYRLRTHSVLPDLSYFSVTPLWGKGPMLSVHPIPLLADIPSWGPCSSGITT